MRGLSLTKKLLLSTLTPILIIFGVLILVAKYKVEQSFEPFVMSSGLNQIEARAGEISAIIDKYRTYLTSLTQILQTEQLEVDTQVESNMGLSEQKQDWFKSEFDLLKEEESLENLFWISSQGQAWFANTQPSFDITQESGIAALLQQKKTEYVSNPRLINSKPIVTFAQAVYVEGQFYGVLGLHLPLEKLVSSVSKISLGQNSYGWLIDGSGLIIKHPNPKVAMKVNVKNADAHGFNGLQQHAPAILNGKSGGGTSHNARGWEVTLIWVPIENTPSWVLSVAVPTRVLNSKISEVTHSLMWIVGISLVVIIVILMVSLRYYLAAIAHTVRMLKEIAEGEADLTQKLRVSSKDELGDLSRYFNQFIARIHKLVAQVVTTTQTLGANSKQIHQASDQMTTDMDAQQIEIDQIAAAMNQLTDRVSDVSVHAKTAFEAATKGRKESKVGNCQIDKTIEAINNQSDVISKTAEQINQLEQSGNQISEVMEVITSITEQINLLALNAAIEAARAGEAGRGFAVVADEVRNLAVKTHDSTNEIQQTVEELLLKIANAVKLMHETSEQAEQTVIQVKSTSETLNNINESIGSVEQVNTQIVQAAQEQKKTVDELNRNLERVVELSKNTITQANQVEQDSVELDESTQSLQGLVSKFKV